MSKTLQAIEALEDVILKKSKSFDEQTSPEEITALAELVRTVSILKKNAPFTN